MASTLSEFFPFWTELTAEQQRLLVQQGKQTTFHKGQIMFSQDKQCLGLIMIQAGQLRAFITSESGKEVSLFRLFDLDICLFSASCIMNNIQFDIQIEVEKDTTALVIPPQVFDKLMKESAAVAHFTNQLMSARFTDVMWLLEQVLFKNLDARLAQVLLNRAENTQSSELFLTHEIIAKDLGSAREVVTRMLNYFRGEGLIDFKRGCIHLHDEARLTAIAES